MLSRMFRFGFLLIITAGWAPAQAADNAPPMPPLPAAHQIASKKFELPVRADAEFRATLSAFRLYRKTPTGPWVLQQEGGPETTKFACEVPEDGEYWYLLATVEKNGAQTPGDLSTEPPNQRVVVKTKQPAEQKQPPVARSVSGRISSGPDKEPAGEKQPPPPPVAKEKTQEPKEKPQPPTPLSDSEKLPPLHTLETRTIDLPVTMDARARAMIREINLYMKTPTAAWTLQQKGGSDTEKFRVTCPADGEFWFTMVTIDNKGVANPPDLANEPPGLRVKIATGQPADEKQPPPPKLPEPPPIKEKVQDPEKQKAASQSKIDTAAADAFGKDSVETRRAIRVAIADIGMVIAAETASVDARGRLCFTTASIAAADGPNRMQRLVGDEIIVATEGPLTSISDLATKRITTIEVRTKKLIIILTAKDTPSSTGPAPGLPSAPAPQSFPLPTGLPPPPSAFNPETPRTVRPVSLSFKFSIDRDAPLTELLPTPPKAAAKLPHWTNEDLAKVPELTFGQSIAKTLPKEKALEVLAHRIAKINHLNRAKTDGFMLALIEQRSDLRGLPFLMGEACRTREEQAKLFAAVVEGIHPFSVGLKENEGPVAEELWRRLSESTGCVQQGKLGRGEKNHLGKAAQDQAFHSIAAASMQIMMPEPAHLRLGLAKFLATVPHIDATKALAKLVLFSPEDEVRAAAIDGLKLRRDKDYTAILLQGFRYPLPAVSKRSAEAIVKLERNDLLENLVQVLEAPDPRLPATEKREGKEVTFVRELVKVNHHRNCLLCHAPGNTENTPEGVLKVAVPLPGEPLPKPAEGGYQSTLPPSPDITVRIDMTYLRQDFSVMMPVSDAHPWPEMQRFDFLVRTRELSAAEAQAFTAPMEPGRLSPYHRAALYALRELTGRDTEPTAAAWRKLLNLPKAAPPATRTTSLRLPTDEWSRAKEPRAQRGLRPQPKCESRKREMAKTRKSE